MDIQHTYWLDQSSVNCGMTRLYGRAPSNERVYDYVPDVRFERTSIMGALGVEEIIAPLVYTGTLNSDLFGVYVEKCLAPAMKKGDTLILDNYSVHKVDNILKPLFDKGINVIFLPPYSPDFSPIELLWAKMKAILRMLKARTFHDLEDVIRVALDAVSSNDLLGWIKHCGYGLR